MKIEFDSNAHVYKIDGIKVPNPTRILEELGITDYSGIPADVLAAAQHFGTVCHTACELHDKGVLDEMTIDPIVRPRLDAWVKFVTENRATVEYTELICGSKAYMFACRLDRSLIIGGKRYICEIKTGSPQQLAPAAYQTAAQQIAFQEYIGKRVDGRLAVLLQEDGNYKMAWYKNKSDTGAFLSMLSTYNIRTQLRKAG